MSLFLPWWVIAIVAFIVATLIPQKPFLAFLAAFVALFLVWGVHASIIDQSNNHILAAKVAEILGLGNSHISIIVVTAVTGAIVAGFGALTGSFLRRLVQVKNNIRIR